jgi:hypothetical protein
MDDVLTTVGRGALPETVAWAGMTAPTVASATMPARIDLRMMLFMESPLERVCAHDEPMPEPLTLTINFCKWGRYRKQTAAYAQGTRMLIINGL